MERREEIEEHLSDLVHIALETNNIRLAKGLMALTEGMWDRIFDHWGDMGSRAFKFYKDLDEMKKMVRAAHIKWARSNLKQIVRDSRRGVDTSKRFNAFKDELLRYCVSYSDIGISEEQFAQLERQAIVSTVRRSINTVQEAIRTGKIGGFHALALDALVGHTNMPGGAYPEIGLTHTELHQLCVDALVTIAKKQLAKLRERKARDPEYTVHFVRKNLKRARVPLSWIGCTNAELESLQGTSRQLKHPLLAATQMLEDFRKERYRPWGHTGERERLESFVSHTGLSLSDLGTSEQELDELVYKRVKEDALREVLYYRTHAPAPLYDHQKERIQEALRIGMTAKDLNISESELQHMMNG